MSYTLPTEPTPVDDLTPDAIADILERAATVIEAEGLCVGDYWPIDFSRNDRENTWEPGRSCCSAAAIGVAAGYRNGREIGDTVVGFARFDGFEPPPVPISTNPHPALRALLKHLGLLTAEELFEWSDEAGQTKVVETLRECATALRPAALADERLVTELIPARTADAAIVRTFAAWRDEVQR